MRRKAGKNPEDVARVQRFQKWVKEQREARGWTYQQVADNYNSQRDEGEATIGATAIRRMEDRPEELETVRRDTCRALALGLNLDVNEVFMQAGYLPSDEYLQLDELPMERRIEYSRLSDKSKARVLRFIQFEYADTVRSK